MLKSIWNRHEAVYKPTFPLPYSYHPLTYPLSTANYRVSKLEYDRYTITVNAWINAHGYYDTMLAVNEKLINDLVKAGIKLPGMT